MADPLVSKIGDKTGVTIVDEADANTTYIGYSISGAATSAALWLIKRVLLSGTVTTTTWADGGGSHDQIWDNRAALTYS